MTDGSVVSYSSDHDSNDMIPPTSTIQQIDFAETKWVLVIEKEVYFFYTVSELSCVVRADQFLARRRSAHW